MNDSVAQEKPAPHRPAAARPIGSDDFASMDRVFAIQGNDMRVHAGRSVVELQLAGVTHYLKRYWLTLSQLFKRHVARGIHEMKMIDWLNNNGFAGPKIVKRGHDMLGPLNKRAYFLMEKLADEVALEAAWQSEHSGDLVADLAKFAARLHDAGFIHTDFSERHILVGDHKGHRTFRLIDVERASVGRAAARDAAADLATLAASVLDDDLRAVIAGEFLDRYIECRKTLDGDVDFRALFSSANPTRSF